MPIYRDLDSNEFDKQVEVSKLPHKLVCGFCEGTELEKMSEKEYICQRCGYGWNGKPANILESIQRIARISKYMITQNPQLSKDDLVEVIIAKIHAIERHPKRPDGYCEYCRRLYK